MGTQCASIYKVSETVINQLLKPQAPFVRWPNLPIYKVFILQGFL